MPEDEERDADVENFFNRLGQAVQISMALDAALDEFTRVRWPHLVEHGILTEEDKDNVLTGGTVIAMLAIPELKALQKLLKKLYDAKELPAALCPLYTWAAVASEVVQDTELVERASQQSQNAEQN